MLEGPITKIVQECDGHNPLEGIDDYTHYLQELARQYIHPFVFPDVEGEGASPPKPTTVPLFPIYIDKY